MQVIPQFLALVVITFFMSNANAWTNKDEVKGAFKTCFHELGIEKYEKGKHVSKEEREKLHACLIQKGVSKETLTEMKEKRKAFREARKACAAETGVKKPEPGEKLSKDDRKKVRACLKDKGFEKPDRHHKV
jgi:uncharacterized membrane protein